jgi:hypothetical protein
MPPLEEHANWNKQHANKKDHWCNYEDNQPGVGYLSGVGKCVNKEQEDKQN